MDSNGSQRPNENGDGAVAVDEHRAALVASKLAPWLIELFHDAEGTTVPPALRLDAAGEKSVALRTLRSFTEDTKLAALLRGPTANIEAVEGRLRELMSGRPVEINSADLLWATLAGEWPVETGGEAASSEARKRAMRRGRRTKGGLLQRVGAFMALCVLIGGGLGLTHVLAPRWRGPGSLTILELFAVVILSFFPGWLFVRFIGFRAGAVWDEYVLNLHRLGVDELQHLPRPPVNSVYYDGWVQAGGPLLGRQSTIYQQKFDAYYGPGVSRSGSGKVTTETLFPLFLFTAVVAVGWTAVFSRDAVFGNARPSAYVTLDVMAFAFMGAYAFTVQMLVRRYFQADLKASAYAGSFVRIAVAVGVVAVVDRAGLLGDGTVQAAVAFVIGSFPLVGLQLMHRAVARVAKTTVPALEFPHPLSDLEGLSIWYEARLLEEGIEDMQNLLTANLPEVILHTRVPVGRLVDWFDQAYLFLRLPPLSEEHRAMPLTWDHPRCVLRRIGVRTASGFLEAFPLDDDGALRPTAQTSVAAVAPFMSAAQLATVSRIIEADPGIEAVWRWRCWRSGLCEDGSGFREGCKHHHRHEPRPKPPLAAASEPAAVPELAAAPVS